MLMAKMAAEVLDGYGGHGEGVRTSADLVDRKAKDSTCAFRARRVSCTIYSALACDVHDILA